MQRVASIIMAIWVEISIRIIGEGLGGVLRGSDYEP